MKISNLFDRIYFNNRALTPREMYVSRSLSIFEGCTARTIFTFTTGAFLVGYAHYLGASDQLSAILSSLPILASLTMLMSAFVLERLPNRKFITTLFCFMSRFILAFMIFIPSLTQNANTRLILLISIFLLSNMLISFVMPAALTWITELTPENVRGKYFGIRESYVLAFVTVITLVAGKILDYFKKSGNEFGGFKVLYIIVIIFAVINAILLSFMKEKKVEVKKHEKGYISLLKIPFKDKKFRKILVLLVCWSLSFQIATPFSAVYMISSLKLNYMYITIMTTIASIVSVLVVRLWGRLADKKSWIFLANVLMLIQALCYFTWFIVNKNNYMVFIPIAFFLFGASVSGMNIAIFNLQYKYSPELGKTAYLGVSAALSGIAGFLGTCLGSLLSGKFVLNYIAKIGLTFQNLQLVFLVSAVLLIICTLAVYRLKGEVHDA